MFGMRFTRLFPLDSLIDLPPLFPPRSFFLLIFFCTSSSNYIMNPDLEHHVPSFSPFPFSSFPGWGTFPAMLPLPVPLWCALAFFWPLFDSQPFMPLPFSHPCFFLLFPTIHQLRACFLLHPTCTSPAPYSVCVLSLRAPRSLFLSLIGSSFF